MKPKVFVASSVEGLDTAYAIQNNLHHDADVTIWSQGAFSPSIAPIDSLTEILTACDFAIFVFSPDDETRVRGVSSNSVRDNVIFELGLFIGKLGKRRCFIVLPDNANLHIPTDLTGVTPVTYSGERDRNEIIAALGPACHAMRTSIKRQGLNRRTEDLSRKIPESSWLNYDDNDKIAILESWLHNNAPEGVAIRYVDVDNSLELEVGSTKRLLPAVLRRNTQYQVNIAGGNVFKFTLNRGSIY